MGQQRPDAGLGEVAALEGALDGAFDGVQPGRVNRARARPTEVLKMAKATVVQRVKESAEVGSMAHQTGPRDSLKVYVQAYISYMLNHLESS